MENQLEKIKLSILKDLGGDNPFLTGKFLKNWLRYKASAQLVLENAKPSRQTKLLDYGCGHPFVSRILNDLGYQVTSYEPHAEVELETARLLGIGHLFCKELPPDVKFNVITMIDVIEHLSIIKPVMRQVNKLTADRGLLLVSTPNVMRIEMWLKFILRQTGHPQALSTFLESDDNFTDHQREFTRKELNLTLKHFGYEVILSKCKTTRDRKALELYHSSIEDKKKLENKKPTIYYTLADGISKWLPGTFANNLFAMGRKINEVS